MLALIAAAIRRRRAQAATLFLLAVLASAGAAAAPGYMVGSTQALAVASVADATGNERLVSASKELSAQPDLGRPLDEFVARMRQELPLPGFETAADVRLQATVAGRAVFIGYREKVCSELLIDGACPAAAGEVAIGSALASSAHLAPGDTLRALLASGEQPANGVPLKVTGIYRPIDAGSAYWGPLPEAKDASVTPIGVRLAGDVLFTPLATFASVPGAKATGSLDYLVTEAAFRQTDPQLLALQYEQARRRLDTENISIISNLRSHADRTWDDQQFIYVGVGVAAVQLLLLCWLALFLAVQLTTDARRSDLGLLKMRGSRRRDGWALMIGQSAVPMLLGGVAGLYLARYLVARVVGDVAGTEIRQQVWYASIAAAGIAVLGALLAAVLAERRTLSESVVSLNRGVARVRRGWAGTVFDVAVVLLAVGGAYEARRRAAEGGQLRGVALVAPILVALAVGLVAARLVPRIAAAVARPSLRSGRLGVGLTAVSLARRPVLTPIFALLTLVVAVFFGTALGWDVADQARAERATFEVGADRVLTVQAETIPALLSAVRAADPQGRYAMAAVRSTSLGVLAVDSPRLGVSPWSHAYGLPSWAEVGALLHPPAAEPYLIRSDRLVLDASWTGDPSPFRVTVRIEGRAPVEFGPLRTGRHEYEASTSGCGETSPCRLVSLSLASRLEKGAAQGGSLTLHSLRIAPAGPEVIGTAQFTDRTRWRAGITSGVQVPLIHAGTAGLELRIGGTTVGEKSTLDAPVFPFDAPSPLPVITAGNQPLGGTVGDWRIRPFPTSSQVAVRVAGTAAAIPRLGAKGVLVDLEYAVRDADLAGGGSMEIWLAPGAPAGLVDTLRSNGIRVVTEEALADRASSLRKQGPSVAQRFVLVVAVVGVALGLGAFILVAAVERGPRRAEFAALRRQGLRVSVVRAAGYGGYLAFVGLAAVLGVATAVAWRALSGDSTPIFGDNWAQLAPPAAGSLQVWLALLALAVLLLLAAAVAGAALSKREKRGGSR